MFRPANFSKALQISLSTVVVAMVVTKTAEQAMSQDQRRPPESSKQFQIPPPPLVNPSAGNGYYQDELFNGPYGLPQAQDLKEIRAELYQCFASHKPDLSSFIVPPEFHERI